VTEAAAAPPILPAIGELNRGFWDAARRGELALQRCTGCDWIRYPVAAICPRCLSKEARWEVLGGQGEIQSHITFHHGYNPAWKDRLPYTVLLVQLDEGPRMFSNLAGAAAADVHVGMRVEALFEPVPGTDVVVPRFAPLVS
jgi:uncharacterized OB-fold protein